MSAGAGAGSVVGRGTIRVDARKAFSKLREHLLLDLHHYLLELVRAAVVMGAREVELRYDADDVTAQWEAAPFDPSLLAKLLDWVLATDPPPEQRALRLLALGVNAALGLGPAWVDLVVSLAPGDDGCRRVRFTPALFDPDGDGPPEPVLESIARPAAMPAAGIRVQLRRRFGWSVLRRAATGGAPPEVAALRAASMDATIGLRIQGELTSPAAPRPLVRVSLAVPGTRRAWLELTRPTAERPRLDFLEQGVRLASVPLSLEPDWPLEPQLTMTIPARIVVDSWELATNASRSAVREDAPELVQATAMARAAFDLAVRALLASLGLDRAPEGPVELVAAAPAERVEALGAIIGVAAAALRQGAPVGALARRLLGVPVLRNACGHPLGYDRLLAAEDGVVFVHRAENALDEELLPWLERVVWPRSTAADRALALFEQRPAEPVVARARQALERRRRHLAHPPAAVALPPSSAHLARERMAVTEGRFAGLSGEVALLGGARARAGVALRLFVDGRPFDAQTIAPDLVPLGLDVALAWDGKLRPGFDFDRIVPDERFRLAVWYAVVSGAMLARSLADRASSLDPSARALLRPLLRAAIASVLLAPERLELPDGEVPALASPDPLVTSACWPTTEPDRFESLEALRRYAARTGAVCVARPDARGRAPDDRPVVALDRAEQAWLVAALPKQAQLVEYDAAVGSGQLLARSATGRRAALRAAVLGGATAPSSSQAWPMMPFSLPRAEGIAAVGAESRCVLLHGGRPICSRPHARRFGPVVFAIDDDTIVPSPRWDSVLWSGSSTPFGRLERELLVAVVAALEGDPAARARLLDPPDLGRLPDALLAAYLFDCAAGLRTQVQIAGALLEQTPAREAKADERPSRLRAARQAELDSLGELFDRLLALRIVPVLGPDGRPRPASLAEIDSIHQGPVPYLTGAVDFETFEWQPLVLESSGLVDAFRRWAPRGVEAASADELDRRRTSAQQRAARRLLLESPRLELTDLSSLAHADSTVHLFEREPPEAAAPAELCGAVEDRPAWMEADGAPSAAVALDRDADLAEPRATLEVLFRRRHLCELTLDAPGLPIVGRVSLTDFDHLGADGSLSYAGAAALRELVTLASLGLTEALLCGSGERGATITFDDPLAIRLVSRLFDALDKTQSPLGVERLRSALRDASVGWPTAQGTVTAFAALLRPDGTVPTANRAFVPWHAEPGPQGDLDAPVLLASEARGGNDLRFIVARLGASPRDVTEALAKLQSRRARRAPEEPPRLPGSPLHPALRASLGALGASSCVGELELVAGPGAEVTLVELEGLGQPLPAELPLPIRSVVRIDTVASSQVVAAVVKEIAAASLELLRALYGRLHELPPFVRAHAQRRLGAELSRDAADPNAIDRLDRGAPLFADTLGRFWSLDDVREGCRDGKRDGVWFTTSPPPYPDRDYRRVVLRLEEPWLLEALRTVASLRNMTNVLADDRAGEERARATPRASLELSDETRGRSVSILPLGAGLLQGEVGILGARGARGLEVHIGRRPLCTLDDRPGWPLAAVVNDDTLRPNRRFDDIASMTERDELRVKVRRAADEHLRRWLAAPPDALASRWLDASLLAADSREDRPIVTGSLWLPAVWPKDPTVLVYTLAHHEGEPLALRASLAQYGLDGRLPLGGALIVVPAANAGADLHRTLVALATSAAHEMLGELESRADVPAALLEIYRWDLWLSAPPPGAAGRVAPRALTTEGASIGPDELGAELRARGRLWFTARGGTSFGRFPHGEPGFLLDAASPLVTVLAARTAPSVLCELGGLGAEGLGVDSAPASAGRAAGADGERGSERERAIPADAAQGDAVAGGELAASPGGEPSSWLDGLKRRIAVAFGGAPLLPADLGKPPPELCAELCAELERLGLPGSPVERVVLGRARRGVRYDEAERVVVLDPRHPAVAALGRLPLEPDLVALLVAAAVGEVNRELGTVTDQEELRVLAELLALRSDAR